MSGKDPDFIFERKISVMHPNYLIAGLDEVGRGSIAGPVTMGCTVLPVNIFDSVEPFFPAGVRDSKLLSQKKRESLVEPIKNWVAGYGVASSSSYVIDRFGIMGGLYLAGWESLLTALNQISSPVAGVAVIVDGPNNLLNMRSFTADPVQEAGYDFPVKVYPKIKGDMECVSVACGSVLAKVERDAMMTQYHQSEPHYGWEKNKGYGSAVHLQAIKDYGVSEHHRKSYKLFK